MRRKALDRAGRKRTIIIWFAIRIQHDNYSYATSYEIAKGLELSASQKLRDILNEMVEDGTLTRTRHDKPGRFQGSGYMLASGTFQAPSKRTIKINRKGAPISQLEMF